MAGSTTRLGLTKPATGEAYDVNIFNNNADIIDNSYLQPVSYAFIDSQPNYAFQGTCEVTTFLNGRKRVDVDLTMLRQNTANSVSATRQDMGVVLPPAAIGTGNSKVLACPFKVSTNLIYLQLIPTTGNLLFWSQTAITWPVDDFVSVNFSYYL